MKKQFFLLTFASLTLAVVGAKAASTQNDSEITRLPAYHFSTDRYTPAERAIESSLAEFRATANVRATSIVLPQVAATLAADKARVEAAIVKNPVPATRLAKS